MNEVCSFSGNDMGEVFNINNCKPLGGGFDLSFLN